MHAGALGYVLKQAAGEALISALRTVARGETYLDPAVAGRVIHSYLGHTASRDISDHTELSEREEEVMRLIASGRSNKEIAAQIGISVKTIEYHKARSMEKLDLRSRAASSAMPYNTAGYTSYKRLVWCVGVTTALP